MMQILEAAGVPPFTDSKRQPDESNQKGYYEHDKVASLLSRPDKFWLREAKGTAIKVVVPLLAALPPRLRKPESEPELLHYRILFMERDIEEVLQSLEASGRCPDAYRQHVAVVAAIDFRRRLARRRVLRFHAIFVVPREGSSVTGVTFIGHEMSLLNLGLYAPLLVPQGATLSKPF